MGKSKGDNSKVVELENKIHRIVRTCEECLSNGTGKDKSLKLIIQICNTQNREVFVER